MGESDDDTDVAEKEEGLQLLLGELSLKDMRIVQIWQDDDDDEATHPSDVIITLDHHLPIRQKSVCKSTSACCSRSGSVFIGTP